MRGSLGLLSKLRAPNYIFPYFCHRFWKPVLFVGGTYLSYLSPDSALWELFLITIGSGDIVNYDSRGLFFAGTPTTKPAFLSFLFSRRVAKSFWSAVSTRIPFPLIFFTWFTLNFSATSETILKTASLVLSELLATPWLAGTIVIAFGGSLFVLVIAAIPDRNANAFGINHIQFNRLPLGFFHGTFQRTLLELSIIL